MTGKRLVRLILAVGLLAAGFGVAEAQQVLEVDSTEIPPVANQAAVDATPCGFGRDLNENQTLINLELFSVHWCDAISGTWEGVASSSGGLSGFTEGEVAVGDDTGSVIGSPGFFWDDANGFLGIGTNAPAATIHIQQNINPTIRLEPLQAARSWDINLPGGLDNFGIGPTGGPLAVFIDDVGATTLTSQGSFFQAVSPSGNIRMTKTGLSTFATIGFGHVLNEFTLDLDGSPVLHIDGSAFFQLGGGTNPSSRLDIGDGSLTMEEIATPSSPTINTLRCYAGDVGGKTALCCIFPTGSEQCSTELVEP